MVIDDSQPRYAGFAMRILASMIDTALSAVVLSPVFSIFNKAVGFSEEQYRALLAQTLTYQEALALISATLPSMGFQLICMTMVILLFWVYRSATPGKMLLKMKIVDAKTLGKPTTAQLVKRYLAYIVSVLPFGFGFVWIYYSKKRQGWHDIIASTVVIHEKSF